ncbi:MAG: exodeoxyribonuclease V subunit gamma, partial [Myxococcota bacterium]
MALSLYFSNRTESLFRKFSVHLDGAWKDPFLPPVLIIQNRLVDKWIKLQLARERGCITAIDGVFLEKFLWNLVAQKNDEAVHAGELQLRILAFLRDIPADSVFDPLREYTGTDARRRVQLSARLARLFLEYEVSRPDLRDATGNPAFKGVAGEWGRGKDSYFSSRVVDSRRDKAAVLERWQAGLYRRLWDAGDGGGTTLPRLWKKVQGEGTLKEKVRAAGISDRPVNVFGAPGFSLFHRQALIDISEFADVNVYLLNPCAEFWEDVRTGRGFGETARDSFLKLDSDDWKKFGEPVEEQQSKWTDSSDNRLLQLWGQVGRDNIALWCQASGYEFDYEAGEPGAESRGVLAAVQRTILSRSGTADNRIPQDGSVEIAAVPGVRREVERLRERIIGLLCMDRSLKLDEIGVFCPDPAKYRAAFDDVFGSVPENSRKDHPHFIPYEFTEQNAGQSLYALAAGSLMDLVDGQFSRSRVFGLLRNPLVRAQRRLSADQVRLWEGWADSLHIHHGFNRDDRALRESAPVGQHTWWRGIERLCLGSLATGPVLLDQRDDATCDPDELVLPFRDMESSDTREIMMFARTVEDLFRDIQAFRAGAEPAGSEGAKHDPLKVAGESSPRTWDGWCDHLKALLETWIDLPIANPEDDHRDYNLERIVRSSLYGSLESIADAAAGDDDKITWEEASLVIRERLEFELPARGSALSGKLMVCTLREARPLPWRVSFVLGMQAGEFPPRENEDRLDLRTWRRMPGDTSPRRSMQYAFLELITCTRERLILSYQCMDMANGALMLPCSTLLELKGFLEDSVLPPGERFTVSEVPLLAEEDPSPVIMLPQTRKLRDASLDPLPSDRTFPEKLLATEPEEAAPGGAAKRPVPWKQAVAVLRDPYSASLKRVLGLYDNEDTDTIESDEEPLSIEAGLDLWKIKGLWLKAIIDEVFAGGEVKSFAEEQIRQIGDNAWAKLRVQLPAAGGIPERLIGDTVWESLKKSCARIPGNISKLCGELEGCTVDREFALETDGEYLTGKTPKFIYCTGRGDSAIVAVTTSEPGSRHFLDAWLLCATGKVRGDARMAGDIRIVVVSNKSEPAERTFSLKRPEAARLLESLRDACSDTGKLWDFLPVEAIENADPPTVEAMQEWIDEGMDSDHGYRVPSEVMTFNPPR